MNSDHLKDDWQNMQNTLKPARLRPRHNNGYPNTTQRQYGIFFLILIWYSFPARVQGEDSAAWQRNAGRLSQIVHNLCQHLQISDNIEVQVDDHNEKMVSSEPLVGPIPGYRISFDRNFLLSLNDDEIIAAVAHELGHVWIFSHHPYLQTEELANEIAMRVVDRETMKKVYAKLWAKTGSVGNLEQLLGPDSKKANPKTAAVMP